jgi:hypothetical protein
MTGLATALPVLVGLGFQLACGLALFLWGRWVARRHADAPSWRLATWAPVAGLVIANSGLVVTALLLVRSFDEVSTRAPEHKADALTAAISAAMWPTALALPLAGLFVFGSVVLFAIGSWLPAKQHAPTHERTPT